MITLSLKPQQVIQSIKRLGLTHQILFKKGQKKMI